MMKIFSISLLLIAVVSGLGQKPEAAKRSVAWKTDDLKKIGGQNVEVLGDPKIVKTDRGKAIHFDGLSDGIFISNNPIMGAEAFTIEAVFRPEAGGGAEQRWLHIEDTENDERRSLLEIRLSGNQWFLDTFIKSGDDRSAIYAENFKHPTDKWYHIALVFDGQEMRHYVDGKLEMSGKMTIKPFGRGKTSIGVRQNKVYWFKGSVLRARFTNRALEPSEFMKNSRIS